MWDGRFVFVVVANVPVVGHGQIGPCLAVLAPVQEAGDTRPLACWFSDTRFVDLHEHIEASGHKCAFVHGRDHPATRPHQAHKIYGARWFGGGDGAGGDKNGRGSRWNREAICALVKNRPACNHGVVIHAIGVDGVQGEATRPRNGEVLGDFVAVEEDQNRLVIGVTVAVIHQAHDEERILAVVAVEEEDLVVDLVHCGQAEEGGGLADAQNFAEVRGRGLHVGRGRVEGGTFQQGGHNSPAAGVVPCGG